MSSHNKRRQYAAQQYDFSQPAAAPPQPVVNNGDMFTPGGIPGPDPSVNDLAGQVNQMNVNTPQQSSYGAYTSQFGKNTKAQTIRTELNALYPTDVLADMPPPISDLQLPPPPLTVPSEISATQSPYANAMPEYMRSTLNVCPNANSTLRKSKLPFALNIRPYATLRDEDENIPLVEDTVIARCRRCRTYVNPFVEFRDQRWVCNICNLTNDVPGAFDWDAVNNVRADRFARNELNYGVVDFVAPKEYLVRAPQPPAIVFVLDVSVSGKSNGLLATAARIIQDNLDRLPNSDGRTRIAIIGVDGVLNFFYIPEDKQEDGDEKDAQEEPRLLVVSDLNDPFLPSPSGLLVRLADCRKGVDTILSNLQTMYQSTNQSSNALGSGLVAAHKLLQNMGGKIICISAAMPNVGVAKLDHRDDAKLYGTPKEHSLFSAAQSFYKSFAVECNKTQVSIDMFLLGPQYQDVASLSNLPRFTAGTTHHYPGWNAARESDVAKFSHELGEHLSQEFGMEAVLRVRASTGCRANAYYGNFFVRSSDLMAFSCFPRDQAYVVEMTLDEPITKPYCFVQAALLHTTCHGERRIRVLNLAIPVSNKLGDIYASADQKAIVSYYAHKATEVAVAKGIHDTQEYLNNQLLQIFRAFKQDVMNTNAGTSGPLQLCTNLRMLPLLINALKKNVAFRPSTRISSDLRVSAMNLLTTMPIPYLIKFLYSDCFALHELSDDAAEYDSEGNFILPYKINLSAEFLQPYGLYLIDDGQVQFLWVGRDAVPQLLLDVFGVSDMTQVPSGKIDLPEVDTPLNTKIRALIEYSRIRNDTVAYPYLYVLKDSSEPSLRVWASTFLVEDRAESEPSYIQYLTEFRRKLST